MEGSTKKCTFHFRQVAMTKQCSWMKTSAQPWNMDFHPLVGGAWALTGLPCSWPTPTTSRRCSSSQPWSLKIKGRKKSLQRPQRCNHPLNPFSAFMIMIKWSASNSYVQGDKDLRCLEQFFSHKSPSYHKDGFPQFAWRDNANVCWSVLTRGQDSKWIRQSDLMVPFYVKNWPMTLKTKFGHELMDKFWPKVWPFFWFFWHFGFFSLQPNSKVVKHIK